jgi:phosphonopyruvate decarboxylase
MIPALLIEELLEHDFSFITGVPDSIFKPLLNSVYTDPRFEHVMTNNEGESCALAAGYHLATGKTPIVYLQNSGFGNCVNPLTSLLDAEIYSIPTLLMIGWRGLPGETDEPQHRKMGVALPGLLAVLDIPFAIADANIEKMKHILKMAKNNFKRYSKPFAILFPNHIIQEENKIKIEKIIPQDAIIREQLLELIVKKSNEDDILITTTGKTSRELYEIRERFHQDHAHDFLTVGSMGCAATIALGVAMQKKERRVILIDGDGACLMRMESLVTIGAQQPKNFIHILVDNNAYESTGSQKTLSDHVDFSALAKACSYVDAIIVDDLDAFEKAFSSIKSGPVMIIVKSYPYSRPNIGRPKTTPLDNKNAFMKQLGIIE